MTREQAERVAETWRVVLPMAEDAVGIFYERLFEIDPSTRPLFAAVPMSRQRRKLAAALDAAVRGLAAPEALLPVLRELGERHARYGVRDAHYDSVGAALLWTLETGLGEAWTPATSAAWAAAYGLVATTMRAAAPSAQAA